MISVGVYSIGVVAPGLPGWEASVPLLRGEQPYRYQPLPGLKPEMLSPNERRRTTSTIKFALVVADDVLRRIDKPAELQSVFTCAEGDMDIINQICQALTKRDRPVSPTHFHNSVHNAPASYWSIANGYRQASTSIAGWRGTFAAGLLEAAVQTLCDARPVLLVAYDLPVPEPLSQLISNQTHFGAALLLSSENDIGARRLATLSVETVAGEYSESTMTEPALEALRASLHAARALPLLQQLAREEGSRVLLPYLTDVALQVEITPC